MAVFTPTGHPESVRNRFGIELLTASLFCWFTFLRVFCLYRYFVIVQRALSFSLWVGMWYLYTVQRRWSYLLNLYDWKAKFLSKELQCWKLIYLFTIMTYSTLATSLPALQININGLLWSQQYTFPKLLFILSLSDIICGDNATLAFEEHLYQVLLNFTNGRLQPSFSLVSIFMSTVTGMGSRGDN